MFITDGFMRPKKCRMIGRRAKFSLYKPQGVKARDLQILTLSEDCLEALRLADMNGLDQEKAANVMNISRATFSRVVNQARKIVASALVQGLAIKIEGGNFSVLNSHENVDVNFVVANKGES